MDNHSRKTYLYQAFGLNIESSIPLSDLIQTTSAADVRISCGSITDALLEELLGDAEVYERPGVKIRATANAMYADWERIGKFLIYGGREVIVEREPTAKEEDLQPFLTNAVLAILLHQRGSFVLHASGVAINGSAVAFIGAKGYGKSTLAAHLKARGHRLISDDIIPIKFEKDCASTVPGFPRIKLYGDSIEAVGESPQNFPLVHRFVEKRSFQWTEDFAFEPLRLNCIYVLAESAEVGVEKLSLPAAFIEIAKNTFLHRYLKAMDYQSEHFRQCQKLIQTVPVFLLKRPHDFAAMDEVCKLIESRAAEIQGENKACYAV